MLTGLVYSISYGNLRRQWRVVWPFGGSAALKPPKHCCLPRPLNRLFWIGLIFKHLKLFINNTSYCVE
jgi:hypothetical protein